MIQQSNYLLMTETVIKLILEGFLIKIEIFIYRFPKYS